MAVGQWVAGKGRQRRPDYSLGGITAMGCGQAPLRQGLEGEQTAPKTRICLVLHPFKWRSTAMQSSTRIEVPARLTVLVTLARLLEQLERTPGAIHPEQYRSVVSHLVRELESVEQDETLRKLLDVFPAASQLYENLQYECAGLCRSPLDASLNAERAARTILERAKQLPSA
jgi:hypothetical protein